MKRIVILAIILLLFIPTVVYAQESYKLVIDDWHYKKDAERVDETFKRKTPVITYGLIIINILCFFIPLLSGDNDAFLDKYCLISSISLSPS